MTQEPTMTKLASQHCAPGACATGMLSQTELAEGMAQLSPAWHVVDNTLHRKLTTPNFAAAFALATRIAFIAERENHHPDLGVGWGYVDVVLTTHAAGGLTINDVIVAARIDGILAEK